MKKEGTIKRDTFRVILYNLIFLFIGFVVIELIFGGWLRKSNQLDNLNLIRERRYVRKVDLYSREEIEIVYTKDKYGLRGGSSYNRPESIDILTIGGSTTDQRFISDEQTWQYVLEKCLSREGHKVIVSNAGIDGQSSFGHIRNFELWFPHIPGLKPSYILFYIGINDLFALASERSYDDLNPEKPFLQQVKQVFSTNSVIYNRIRILFGWMVANNIGIGHHKTDFNSLQYTRSGIPGTRVHELQKRYLETFEQRVRKLIDLTTRMGSTPIFVTQPSILYRFDSTGTVEGISEEQTALRFGDRAGDTAIFNGVDYYHLIKRMNETIVKACDQHYLVIDLTDRPFWRTDDFYDYVHTTPQGSRKIGEALCEPLRALSYPNRSNFRNAGIGTIRNLHTFTSWSDSSYTSGRRRSESD